MNIFSAIGDSAKNLATTVLVIVTLPVALPFAYAMFMNDCPSDIATSNKKYEKLEHLQHKHFKSKKDKAEIIELEKEAEAENAKWVEEQESEHAKWVQEHK
jgi:hypothetical protein